MVSYKDLRSIVRLHIDDYKNDDVYPYVFIKKTISIYYYDNLYWLLKFIGTSKQLNKNADYLKTNLKWKISKNQIFSNVIYWTFPKKRLFLYQSSYTEKIFKTFLYE